MKPVIGIPMGINLAPFWANPFLYSYEEEYMSSLISSDKIKVRRYHLTKRFIDDLFAINDGGEFGKSVIYSVIYKYIQRSSNIMLNIRVIMLRF